MKMQIIKNVRVKEDIWWRLNKLKVEYKFTTLSDVIEYLVNKEKIK